MSNALPNADELEISVFGPGYGESIVIHVGNGNWFVIDCCLDSSTKHPKPLLYLQSIGVNLKVNVKLVVATHWHDDHVAGLTKLLSNCSSALFCCPVSLAGNEFLKLASLYKDAPVGQRPGTQELRDSIELAARRSKAEKKQMLKFAKADTKIIGLRDYNVELYALSPSDEMVRRCNEFMVSCYAAATSQTNILQRLISKTPNDTAAALRLSIGSRIILLGSDVENNIDPLVGWPSIVQSHSLNEGVYNPFKVAHHGSKSGHNDEVWGKLLTKNPISMITPFRLGRHKLPTDDDRARILSLTDRAYITAHPNHESVPKQKRSSKVEAYITSATKSRRAAISSVGHIRWRAPIEDESNVGKVELFDGAMSLDKVA